MRARSRPSRRWQPRPTRSTPVCSPSSAAAHRARARRLPPDRPRPLKRRGEKLYISDTTVKTHITHIPQKLDLRDRVQAVVLAYETGLFTTDEQPTTHSDGQ